ncbi:MAG: hypothetical protein V3T05_05100 [Myxococcota bacterium]
MGDKAPSTREIIAEAESLRGNKKAKKPQKTRQLVRDAEKLISPEGARSGGQSKAIVYAILFVVALVAASVIYFYLL